METDYEPAGGQPVPGLLCPNHGQDARIYGPGSADVGESHSSNTEWREVAGGGPGSRRSELYITERAGLHDGHSSGGGARAENGGGRSLG